MDGAQYLLNANRGQKYLHGTLPPTSFTHSDAFYLGERFLNALYHAALEDERTVIYQLSHRIITENIKRAMRWHLMALLVLIRILPVGRVELRRLQHHPGQQLLKVSPKFGIAFCVPSIEMILTQVSCRMLKAHAVRGLLRRLSCTNRPVPRKT